MIRRSSRRALVVYGLALGTLLALAAAQTSPDCSPVPLGAEQLCHDGIDNDGDGWTDCLDPDCATDCSGFPDWGFAGGGTLVFDPSGSNDEARGLAILPTGRIVVAGSTWNSGTPGSYDLLTAAFGPYGSLDTGYGAGTGYVTTDISGGADRLLDIAYYGGDGTVVIPGHLVAVGYGETVGGQQPAVAGYDTDGNLLPGFGTTNPFVETGLYASASLHRGVAFRTDGSFYVGGNGTGGGPFQSHVGRYDASGSVDATFGFVSPGPVVAGGNSGGAVACELASGTSYLGAALEVGYDDDLMVAAYGTAGGPEPGWNAGQPFTADLTAGLGGLDDPAASADRINAVAVDSAGRVLVAGEFYQQSPDDDFDSDFFVVRLLADGSPDPAFGTDGIVTVDFMGARDTAHGLAVRPSDGTIVVCGHVQQGAGGDDAFGAIRLDEFGALDPAFGNGGKSIVDVVAGADDGAYDCAVAADGATVMAGAAYNGSNYDIAVVQLLP